MAAPMELHLSAEGDFFTVYGAGHEHEGQSERLLAGQYASVNSDGTTWILDAERRPVYWCLGLDDITIHGATHYVSWATDGTLLALVAPHEAALSDMTVEDVWMTPPASDDDY